MGDLTLYSPVVTVCITSIKIQKFYVLPTQCSYVFSMDLRTSGVPKNFFRVGFNKFS